MRDSKENNIFNRIASRVNHATEIEETSWPFPEIFIRALSVWRGLLP